jgi:hypothetical protein
LILQLCADALFSDQMFGWSRLGWPRGSAILGRTERPGELRAGAETPLPVDAAEMMLDSLRAEEEGRGDLLVGQSLWLAASWILAAHSPRPATSLIRKRASASSASARVRCPPSSLSAAEARSSTGVRHRTGVLFEHPECEQGMAANSDPEPPAAVAYGAQYRTD